MFVFVQYLIVKEQKMKESKTWTQEVETDLLQEDEVLRELREQRGMKKWSQISLTMELEFEMGGKSGKRCRQRYFNYASSLVKREEWSEAEEKSLFRLHNQKGNKWMQIAKQLQRPDNAVKNHYHSKLRKSLRRINKLIYDYLRNEFKSIKSSILPKMLQTAEDYYSQVDKSQETTAKKCYDMKNTILAFLDQKQEKLNSKEIASLKNLVKEANYFNKTFKKRKNKKEYSKRVRCNEYKGKQILKLIKENNKSEQKNNEMSHASSDLSSSQQSAPESSVGVRSLHQDQVQNSNQKDGRNKIAEEHPAKQRKDCVMTLHALPYNYPFPVPVHMMLINPFAAYHPANYQNFVSIGALPQSINYHQNHQT